MSPLIAAKDTTRGEVIWQLESTVSSVRRANNSVAVTATRVMCTDVIRLPAACGSWFQTNRAFRDLTGFSCCTALREAVIEVSEGKGGDFYIIWQMVHYIFLFPKVMSVCWWRWCIWGVRKMRTNVWWRMSRHHGLIFNQQQYLTRM